MSKTLKTELYSLDDIAAMGMSDLDIAQIIPAECWQLIKNNPDIVSDLPVAGVAKLNEKVVSSVAIVHRPILWRGHRYACAWDYSFYTDPRYQQYGAGGLILRKVLRALRARKVRLASLGATPDANRVYRSLGMSHQQDISRYVLPLRSGVILNRYLPIPIVASILEVPLNACISLAMSSLLFFRGGARITESVHESVGEGLERLVCDKQLAHLSRSEEHINWIIEYARQFPHEEIKLVTIQDENMCVSGYYLARVGVHSSLGSSEFKNVRLFRVLDAIVENNADVCSALVRSVVNHAKKSKCDVVEVINSDEKLTKACRRLGFISSGVYSFYLSQVKDGLADAAARDWHLAMLESENSFV